jgi:hypothetical protein
MRAGEFPLARERASPAEALNDTANGWPNILRGHQDPRLAFAVNLLETFANERDKCRGPISASTCSESVTGLREQAMLSAILQGGDEI